jgi:hypothetical protein
MKEITIVAFEKMIFSLNGKTVNVDKIEYEAMAAYQV